MSYLVLPHISVQRANAMATPYMMGVCPVFAAVMLGHAIGRKTGAQPSGVALVHHDATLLAERGMADHGTDVFPHQFRAASFIDMDDTAANNKTALSLQPSATAHLEVSLVLAYTGLAPDPAQVDEVLPGLRLAGGTIVDSWRTKACAAMAGRDGVFSHLRSGGFFVLDRTATLDTQDRLGSLLGFLYPKTGCRPPPFEKAFLAPAVLGYAMLTDFEAREGAREGAPHAFAEAMLGLVQYESLRRLRETTALFWSGRWHARDAFVLEQGVA